MANFFERLGEQSGERTTETPSDHPDPASRVAALDEIIPTLRLAVLALDGYALVSA